MIPGPDVLISIAIFAIVAVVWIALVITPVIGMINNSRVSSRRSRLVFSALIILCPIVSALMGQWSALFVATFGPLLLGAAFVIWHPKRQIVLIEDGAVAIDSQGLAKGVPIYELERIQVTGVSASGAGNVCWNLIGRSGHSVMFSSGDWGAADILDTLERMLPGFNEVQALDMGLAACALEQFVDVWHRP